MRLSGGTRIVATVALMVCLCSCGDDEAPSDDGGDADFDVQEFEDGLDRYARYDDAELRYVLVAEAICEVSWECADEHYDAVVLSTYPRGLRSKQECIDELIAADLSDGPSALEEAAFSAGRITVDRDRLPECRGQFLSDYCEENRVDELIWGHPCGDVFAGTVDEGEYCHLHDECRGSLECETAQESEGEDACYGICGEPEIPARSCNGEFCEGAAYCKYSGPEEPACMPRVMEGEPCTKSAACAQGLWCSADGVCSPIRIQSEGQECQRGYDFCEAGTVCVEDVDDSDGEPGECRRAGADGDSCVRNAHCRFPLVCLGARQGEEGVCGLGALGDPCSQDANCREGLCLPGGPDSSCEMPLEDGSPCEWSGECESGFCDPDSMVCADDEVCELP